MRFFMLSLIILTISAATGGADESWDRSFYFGAVVGESEFQLPNGSHDNEFDAGGIVGVSWTQEQVFGAIEAEYAAALGNHNVTDIQGITNASISVLAGFIPVEDFSIYGRFGFQRSAIEMMDNTQDDALGIRLGLGAEYEIGSGFHARAEVGHRFLNGTFGDDLSRTVMQMAIIQQF